MARQVRRNWWEWCDFGDHVIKAGDGHMHVYPIPTCEAFPDGGTDAQGGTSCLACYDNVLKLQVEVTRRIHRRDPIRIERLKYELHVGSAAAIDRLFGRGRRGDQRGHARCPEVPGQARGRKALRDLCAVRARQDCEGQRRLQTHARRYGNLPARLLHRLDEEISTSQRVVARGGVRAAALYGGQDVDRLFLRWQTQSACVAVREANAFRTVPHWRSYATSGFCNLAAVLLSIMGARTKPASRGDARFGIERKLLRMGIRLPSWP